MKQKPFNRSLDLFTKIVESGGQVSLPVELLVFFCSTIKNKAIVYVDSKGLDYLYHNFKDSFDIVDFLPSMAFFDKNTPAGFKSGVRESREKVLSQVSIGLFPRLLFTTTTSVVEKSIKRGGNQYIDVFPGLEYDVFVGWLKSSKYSLAEIVLKQGDFVLKGGIIDVFPFNHDSPVRVSFLGEEVEVFCFDTESQTTNKRVPPLRVANRSLGRELSVSDFIPTDTLVINYSLNIKNTLGGCYKTINFNQYIKNKKSYNIEVLPFGCLINNGYLFSDKIIVPPWFLGRYLPDKPSNTNQAIDFGSLSAGDRVVHKYYGVSEYKGIFDFGDKNSSDERLLLEYSDGGKIYVSIQNLGLLEYHSSFDISSFDLDSLSKKGSWVNKKRGAKKQVEEIIDDLLNNYAARSTISKAPIRPELELEKQFLDAFPFEETEDQRLSWGDVSSDLNSEKPMDRLLCGDVGFGKTEIALRASFRVVFSEKQVAVLVPTTILASQHFHSFCGRLGPFSINVGLISAFNTKSQNKQTLDDLKNGNIDVIIGTHSLLSDGVEFSNLGLMVIDEEHRFGVKQKEKILNMKNNIDVLSMSATPIPRTLHMSLSGIKSISTINTPPKARFPISTQIQFYDIKQIRSLIMIEINRGGQVFFVHNRVKSLDEIVQALRQQLPDLAIEPAHGQTPKKQLDNTMTCFIDGKIDVLVCTSIIETGINIPNVNTIIVNRAHRFGLSQLYQIRGRVGRSDKQAFAYLLIPKGHRLSKNAYKRLKSIEKNTSLGSGYNISKSDMEIRGAGTLFGYKQSGGLSRIGYGLYSKLIKESLEERGIVNKTFILPPEDTSVKLYLDMVIPNKYISSSSVRLEFYRKLSKCDALDRFSEIEYELKNRYGPIPSSTINLINNYKTKIYCARLGLKKCVVKERVLQLEFLAQGVARAVDVFVPKIIELCVEQNAEPRFLPGNNKALIVNININNNKDIYTFVKTILDKLTALILA